MDLRHFLPHLAVWPTFLQANNINCSEGFLSRVPLIRCYIYAQRQAGDKTTPNWMMQ